jgi:hypothetical protein
MRLAEVNCDRYWLPRLPNALGWLHRELHDLETAVRLDAESIHRAREFAFPEAEANALVNLGHDYLVLGEAARFRAPSGSRAHLRSRCLAALAVQPALAG